MILNAFPRKCVSHDHFQHPVTDDISIQPVGANSYVALCFSVCPGILPYIYITCYNFEAFLCILFHFL